jgi:hypothetical protein
MAETQGSTQRTTLNVFDELREDGDAAASPARGAGRVEQAGVT